jgi:hypothetical protein
MIYFPWALLAILVIAAVGLYIFRGKVDPDIRKIIIFVLLVLVVLWIVSMVAGWWPHNGTIVVHERY